MVFALEVGYGGLVVPADGVSASFHAAVHEELDVAAEALVDEAFALAHLAFDGDALAHRDLDGVDAPDGLLGYFFGGVEEAGDVVQVALDELDGR